jgi:hypothetical protein
MLLNCEICVHQESRSGRESKFRRWTDYEAHMSQVHGLEVHKDGVHTLPSNPKPMPKADEL